MVHMSVSVWYILLLIIAFRTSSHLTNTIKRCFFPSAAATYLLVHKQLLFYLVDIV